MPQLVTLAEAKSLLQSPAEDDGLVSDLIERASAAVESYTRRRILHAKVLDLLPGGSKALVLRYRPVVSVEQVVDLESQQAVSTEDYVIDSRAGLILRRRGKWPKGDLRWEVRYTAGYAATVDDVPADIKQAVLLLVQTWYQRRDPAIQQERIGDYSYTLADRRGWPDAVQDLLAPYVEVVV
ncbi:hypothetical protein Tmar_0040 [Thermaerobacter marianensis DSM 12885]|uniref:Phage gp6-like head-tail connector protein n=1 Tax=Thermaerobacter marianensis (strain ATCC 700841 / DSM 12885 / JCM 10246 / 7p75a) TaxID=644966 RepID=E6SKH8_THEM7|nr:phage head-tail connector protein [Thermaerobacter marianensis]ADU50165.1 hypothetical protein Tmar_0040 [Thermaerobacter marianensis DSM 12885]